MNGATTQTQASAIQQAQAANDQISALIRGTATKVTQSIYNNTIVTPGSSNNQVQIPLRNVGLLQGFIVQIKAAMTNTGGSAANLATGFNAANILSNISFYDLDNYQRINCAGWFMNLLGTAKEGFPFGAAVLSTAMDSPVSYGNNFSVISATSTLAATTGTGTVNMRYWIPAAYSTSDLRGSLYMGVVNATAYLQLTINPSPGVTTGDATLAVYAGASTVVAISSVLVSVYQVYWDQLPKYPSGPNAGAPILPPIDIATQYRMVTTSLTGISVGQDFPVPFSNFQQFLSLGIIYDQAGTLNSGSDINYFALAAANTYQLFKVDPYTQALKERQRMMTDLPPGTYLFDFRDAPVNTNQTGNMQLLLNAITAANGSQVLAGFESFALINNVLGAASLPAS